MNMYENVTEIMLIKTEMYDIMWWPYFRSVQNIMEVFTVNRFCIVTSYPRLEILSLNCWKYPLKIRLRFLEVHT